jgi:hypothetical protein
MFQPATVAIENRVTFLQLRTELHGGASQLFESFAKFADAFLLIFANETQLGDDVGQLFDVLIFDHQVHGVLSQSLNDGSSHG